MEEMCTLLETCKSGSWVSPQIHETDSVLSQPRAIPPESQTSGSTACTATTPSSSTPAACACSKTGSSSPGIRSWTGRSSPV